MTDTWDDIPITDKEAADVQRILAGVEVGARHRCRRHRAALGEPSNARGPVVGHRRPAGMAKPLLVMAGVAAASMAVMAIVLSLSFDDGSRVNAEPFRPTVANQPPPAGTGPGTGGNGSGPDSIAESRTPADVGSPSPVAANQLDDGQPAAEPAGTPYRAPATAAAPQCPRTDTPADADPTPSSSGSTEPAPEPPPVDDGRDPGVAGDPAPSDTSPSDEPKEGDAGGGGPGADGDGDGGDGDPAPADPTPDPGASGP